MTHTAIAVLILIASATLAGWALWRAHRLHIHIEEIHPGFNRFMRRCNKGRRR